jgi:hypothetical protein
LKRALQLISVLDGQGRRMMRLRWSPGEGLDLAGHHVELRALRDVVLATAAMESGLARVPTVSYGDPAPYASFLSAIEIRRVQGPLTIKVTQDGILEVTGGSEALNGFASFLRFDGDGTAGAHSHVEFYEGHPFISRSSEPLVVTLEAEAGSRAVQRGDPPDERAPSTKPPARR